MLERKFKLIGHEVVKVMDWQELEKINNEENVRANKEKGADKRN